MARLPLAAIAIYNFIVLADNHYFVSIMLYLLRYIHPIAFITVYPIDRILYTLHCICHITFITINLLYCIYFIAFTALHLLCCIYHIALIILHLLHFIYCSVKQYYFNT